MGQLKSKNRVLDDKTSIPPPQGGFNLKYAILTAVAAALLLGPVWGFCVDDAWIVSRVAHHGARFGQYHYNLGVETDAVTPLGFAHLLGTWGRWSGQDEALELFRAARTSGLIAYHLSFFLAGGLVQARRPWPILLLVGGCLPAAVWAGAGLATAWCGLFLTAGEGARRWGRDRLASVCWGAAVAWRPELALLTTYLMFGGSCGRGRASWERWVQLWGAFVGPILLTACWRWMTFGSWLPLSATAKAPNLESGVVYGAISIVWGGLVLAALVAPGAFRWQGVGWCVASHGLAVVLSGGDWMPALRLWAPIYPLVLLRLFDAPLVFASLSRLGWIRWGAACLWAPFMPTLLLVQQGADYRAVVERRLALVDSGRKPLAGAQNVAAVDIGWVGLATSAIVTDLGGVTDPRIGRLAGGHTNRLISPGLFSDRDIDAWVIRLNDRSFALGDDLRELNPVYGTDLRLLRAGAAQDMKAVALLPLPATAGQYVVLRQH